MSKHSARRIVFTAVSLFILGSAASAAEFRELKGEYVVAPKGTKGRMEFGVIVRGRAARELYTNLPFQAKPDACTGRMQKADPQGMFCIKNGKEYVCSLGLDLTTREISAGPLTC